jgi:intracellular sulfur oxidation DsrE/DsrF family protein
MTKYFTTVMLLIVAILGNTNVWAQKKKNAEPVKQHRIVMQLTSADEKAHKSLTKQLNNLKDGWGDTVTIEVVCHGPGIDFLTTDKTKFADEIYKLKTRGIVFVVCENSLKEREVPKEAILPEMQYVKMGIGEIVIKQEQGWIYIKAGF